MNFPIYSIETELIKECELVVSNLAFAILQNYGVLFSFDISFSQMAAKRTFGPINQLSF